MNSSRAYTRIVLVDLDNILFYDSQQNVACLQSRLMALRQSFLKGVGGSKTAIELFCNHATANVVREIPEWTTMHATMGTPTTMLRLYHTPDNTKDAADYMLLQHLHRHILRYASSSYVGGRAAAAAMEVVVVTSDKNLARMANYMCHPPPNSSTPPLKASNGGKGISLSYAVFQDAHKAVKRAAAASAAAPPPQCQQLKVYPWDRFSLTFNDRHDLDKFIEYLQTFKQRFPSSVYVNN